MCEIIKTGSHYKFNGRKVNEYKMILDESHKYTGSHPLEYRDHYENLLEERGIIEMDISNVKIENGKLIISYSEK